MDKTFHLICFGQCTKQTPSRLVFASGRVEFPNRRFSQWTKQANLSFLASGQKLPSRFFWPVGAGNSLIGDSASGQTIPCQLVWPVYRKRHLVWFLASGRVEFPNRRFNQWTKKPISFFGPVNRKCHLVLFGQWVQ